MTEYKPTIWTKGRLRVLSALKKLPEPILAQLYEHATDLASDYVSDSDRAQFDIAIIGHCIRELMNSLSYYLGGNTLPGRNRSGVEDQAIRELREVILSDCSDADFIPSAHTVHIPIPISLAKALRSFREAAKEGKSSSEKSASIGAIGYVEEGNPVTALWNRARKSFVDYAHLSRGERKLPTRHELLHNLDILDNALINRLGFFFDAKHRVSDILKRANSCNNGEYTSPSEKDLDEALSLFGNPGIRFVFYSGLTNPEWLAPLDMRKAFERGITQEFDGRHDASWPEAIYLRAIAHEKSEDVTKIIVRASSKPHPTIRLLAIDLGCYLPLEKAAIIAREATRWAREHYQDNGFFWIHEEVTSLIARLMESDNVSERRAGKTLFEACFEPFQDENRLSGCRALIPDWSYSERLSRLQRGIDGLSLSARTAIFCTFSKALLFRNASGEFSSYSISSISEACENHHESMKGEIVYQLVQAYYAFLSHDPDRAIAAIEKRRDNPIALRCALFACQSLIEQCQSSQPDISQAVWSFLREALLSGLILDDEFEAELYPLYAPVVRAGIISSSEYFAHIHSSYEAMIKEYHSKFEALNLTGIEDPQLCARRWEHRALTLAGHDILDDRGKLRYQELSKEFGSAQYRFSHGIETITITGPNSPLSNEELSRMTSDELIVFLKAWHPSAEDQEKLISHLGLGRHLSRKVSEDPFVFDGKAAELLELRATYQTSILDGWSGALRDNRAVPVKVVLKLLEYASKRSEKEAWQPEGDSFDDDFNYLNLRRGAASLAVDLLDSSIALSDEQNDSLLDSIMRLSRSEEPDLEYEAKYGGSNSDPFTLSLNTIRPIAIRGLAKWVKANARSRRTGEALTCLEEHLPNKSCSEADAAALGEALPWLVETNIEWARKCQSALLGADKPNQYQQIVLTTALALYTFSPRLLEFCSSAMTAAVNDPTNSYAIGLRINRSDCVTLIGKQLYRAFIIGWINWDDSLLASLWSQAEAVQVGNILRSICEMTGNGEGVTEDIASRIGRLWDYHAEVLVKKKGASSLRGIVPLIRSGCYAAVWWGPRLLKELTANPEAISLFMLEEEIMGLVEEMPELTMDIIRRIIEYDQHPIAAYYEQYGIAILKQLKNRNGGTLTADAAAFMDLLGKIGCLDIDEKLEC